MTAADRITSILRTARLPDAARLLTALADAVADAGSVEEIAAAIREASAERVRISREKRAIEKALQANGYSRRAAVAAVARQTK